MLKIILIIIVVALLLLFAYAATKPKHFRIQRSLLIKAPAEKLFVILSDFHQWTIWSPYEKKDPSMQRTFSGAANGVGAIYEWSGDKNVGRGCMEIVKASAPNELIIKLDFFVPFEAHNTAEFTIEQQGDSALVTWAMFGESPLISRVMCLFFDMDAMVGKDFEAGLQALKAATE